MAGEVERGTGSVRGGDQNAQVSASVTSCNPIPHFCTAFQSRNTLRHRCDVLERRADDHDKSIARSKELGMELQDAFAYVQKFSTTSQAPLPPPHDTPSGQSAASLVIVLKE